MSKKKKSVGEGLLEGMKQALEHAQNAEVASSERLQSQEDDLLAANAGIDQEELKNELQKELKRFLIPKLRSASYRWKFRSDAIKAARKSRGIYECNICKCDMKNGEFVADHKSPVVPFEGWDGRNWTQYIERMFVDANGFQIICKSCHEIKTDSEIQIRKMYRQKKKKNEGN